MKSILLSTGILGFALSQITNFGNKIPRVGQVDLMLQANGVPFVK